MDTLMASYKDVAAQGKAEYDASRNPSNTTDPVTGENTFKYESSLDDLKAFPYVTVTMRGLKFIYDPKTKKYLASHGDKNFKFTEEELRKYLTR